MSQGEGGGRPVLWENPEDLEVQIADYFATIDLHNRQNPQYVRPYTLSGLAYHIGCSRLSIVNYGKKDRFFNTIKRAKNKIEAFQEEQLYRNTQVTGVIFSLKVNYKWNDRVEEDDKGQQDFADAIDDDKNRSDTST